MNLSNFLNSFTHALPSHADVMSSQFNRVLVINYNQQAVLISYSN